MSRFLTFTLAVGLVLVASVAEARQVRFAGIHPVESQYGGGFCYIEGPHVHVYEPSHADVLYRQGPHGHHFVGDPVAHGYEGPKHAYYGHHPIPVSVVVGVGAPDDFCFLDGPHYHHYLPPPTMRFVLKGGVHFFAGETPQIFLQARPRHSRINVHYKPIRYARPVVVVAPPPEYRGPVVGVVTPGVHVHGAAPGVHVHGHVGVGVVVPPPPSVHVGVHIGAPAPVIVAPGHTEVHVIKVKEKKHKHHRGNGGWKD